MHRYQNNAFRVLGVLPSASTSDIMHRANEIKVKMSLGADITYEYDFPWMGTLSRNEQSLINAVQRLEDPISRIQEELAWFWIYSERDRQAINLLSQQKRQAAHDVWYGEKNIYNANTNDIVAYLNQTILAHSSVMSKEMNLKHGERDGGLGNKHWTNWRFAIDRFVSLESCDSFWDIIRKRVKEINDPRLSESRLEEIRKGFLPKIVNINLIFLGDALTGKDYDRIRGHSNLINGLNLQVDILKQGLNRTLLPLIESINKHCEVTSNKVLALKKGDSKESLLKIYDSFIRTVENIVSDGNMIDINNISDFAISKDKISDVVRSISIKINNDFDDSTKAHEIMNIASKYATSAHKKQFLKKDEEIVKKNVEQEKALQFHDDKLSVSITKGQVQSGTVTISTRDIIGIRYGIYTHSTNGVVDRRSYKFWLTDNEKFIEIECAKGFFVSKETMEKRYNEIQNVLFQLVQIPLVLNMVNILKTGQIAKFNKDLGIDRQGWHREFSYNPLSAGIMSVASGILGTESVESREAKKKFLPWSEYGGYNFWQGTVIIWKKDKKQWASFNLREDWNAVNIGLLLDYVSKNGL